MPKTRILKLAIEKFRALNDVEIEFGEYITVVCGKNGTSKSSILGIAAQIFSFDKDYERAQSLQFRQIAGGSFKSPYREHFRISDKFDVPGSMTVNIEIHDGYTDKLATAKLELMSRGKLPRPVVRNNSTASGDSNSSRNFTHPVIFLSLKRLFPIADRDYKVIDFDFLKQHKQDFIGLTNELLNRRSTLATGTGGSISSAVAHGETYDQNSVSAGEDNAGQIILALMSFRKLKAEYNDYKGGLLLIDEADAGLFPTAQINLLRILERECKSLDLQVVLTSHSPVLIERAFEYSQSFRKKFKTIYLSNTFGNVKVMQNWSWAQISADINTRTITTQSGISLPRPHVYFEDREAADFFNALMSRQPLKKFVKPLPDITLGSSNYIQLIQKRIPEFSERSVVCLDADRATLFTGKQFSTTVLLPGHLPPDQLIFEHLYNLNAADNFWNNDLQFTRDVFTNMAADVIREFSINADKIDVKALVEQYAGNRKPREIFKRFYKNEDFQKLVGAGTKSHNPWKHWVESNPEATNKFLSDFQGTLAKVMKNAYAVDTAKLAALEIRPKKV